MQIEAIIIRRSTNHLENTPKLQIYTKNLIGARFKVKLVLLKKTLNFDLVIINDSFKMKYSINSFL